jgi:hypothetical protein
MPSQLLRELEAKQNKQREQQEAAGAAQLASMSTHQSTRQTGIAAGRAVAEPFEEVQHVNSACRLVMRVSFA